MIPICGCSSHPPQCDSSKRVKPYGSPIGVDEIPYRPPKLLWLHLQARKYADIIVPFPIASLCGLRALQLLAADGRTPLVVPKLQIPDVGVCGIYNHIAYRTSQNAVLHRGCKNRAFEHGHASVMLVCPNSTAWQYPRMEASKNLSSGRFRPTMRLSEFL